MIKKLPKSVKNIIGVEVIGKIDSKEEAKWIEIFDNLIKEHGDISILILLDKGFSIDFGAAYDDFKWVLKNIKHINKLAFVSESKVLGWLVTIDSPFGKLVGVSEKHFETKNLQDAWDWVKE